MISAVFYFLPVLSSFKNSPVYSATVKGKETAYAIPTRMEA